MGYRNEWGMDNKEIRLMPIEERGPRSLALTPLPVPL